MVFALSVEDKNSEVYCCYEKVLSKLKFSEKFISSLHQNDFFVNFFRGMAEINDVETTISCLRAICLFSRISYCSDYRVFAEFLKKLMKSEDDDVATMAVMAACELSSYSKLARLFESLGFRKIARRFDHGHAKQYARDLIDNLR